MSIGPKLGCQEVSRLISAGEDGALPPAERARLRLHFVICESCRNVAQQIGFLRRAMQSLRNDEGRPPQ